MMCAGQTGTLLCLPRRCHTDGSNSTIWREVLARILDPSMAQQIDRYLKVPAKIALGISGIRRFPYPRYERVFEKYRYFPGLNVVIFWNS